MNLVDEKIRKIREIKGYSQEYMALQLKMSQNNYSRIELDQQNKLSLDRLQEIANVLELTQWTYLILTSVMFSKVLRIAKQVEKQKAGYSTTKVLSKN